MSLRFVQREAVFDTLKWGHEHNTNHTNSNELTSAWRVLILDVHAQEVIAPLLKVKELREQAGVTLHLRLEKPRQAVAGAPAIYICMPTEANVEQIAKDVEEGLFSEYRIQFLATAPRTVLEKLAQGLQNVSSIHNVFVADRALNYVALQGDLFTVPHAERICYAFNSKHLHEKELENQVRLLAQSLSHVAASVSPSAPFISYMKSSAGSAAEAVAHQLHSTLHDHIKERSAYFSNANSPSKTLFLIVDRMSDLNTALHHHFSYRSLLSDAMEMKLNKIVVNESSAKNDSAVAALAGRSNDGKKQLEVDPETDQFWNEHSERDFRTVHEYVDAALASYQKEYQALMASEGIPSTGDSASDLARLMQQAPKLADRKRSIDTHVLLAFQCLQAIKLRHLDELHGVEQALLHPASMSIDKETIEKLLDVNNPDYKGVLESDRERLLLMCYLTGTEHGNKYKDLLAYVERHMASLESAGVKMNEASDQTGTGNAANKQKLFPALAFLKKLRSFSAPGAGRSAQQQSAASSSWGFATDFFSKLTGGDKNVSPVARIADSIHQTLTSSSSSSNSSSEVLFLDPRLRDSSPVNENSVRAAGVNHLVVFFVGGVCPIEYEDLLKWSDSKGGYSGPGAGISSGSGGAGGGSSGNAGGSGGNAGTGNNSGNAVGGHNRSTSSAHHAGSAWAVTVGGTEILTGSSLLSQLTELGSE